MAIALTTLVDEADRYLNAARISDYCPNGLQVEGRPQVRRIVMASPPVRRYSTPPSRPMPTWCWCTTVTSGRARTLRHWDEAPPFETLLGNDISLLAYHLPLDVHPEVGNNVQLAAQLGITVEARWNPMIRAPWAWSAHWLKPMTRRILPRMCSGCWGVSRCWLKARA